MVLLSPVKPDKELPRGPVSVASTPTPILPDAGRLGDVQVDGQIAQPGTVRAAAGLPNVPGSQKLSPPLSALAAIEFSRTAPHRAAPIAASGSATSG